MRRGKDSNIFQDLPIAVVQAPVIVLFILSPPPHPSIPPGVINLPLQQVKNQLSRDIRTLRTKCDLLRLPTEMSSFKIWRRDVKYDIFRGFFFSTTLLPLMTDVL